MTDCRAGENGWIVLKQLQDYAEDLLNDATLAALDADLAKPVEH